MFEKRAPYEGRKSATSINKSYDYRANHYFDKTIISLDLYGNNYLSQNYKQLLQSLQLMCNFLIYFNIQVSFKHRKPFFTFYLNKFLKLIAKMKMV